MLDTFLGGDAFGWGYRTSDGNKYNNGGGSAFGAAFGAGDVIGFEFDIAAGSLAVLKNNVSQGAITGITGIDFLPAVSCYANPSACTFNFGATAFVYSSPTGSTDRWSS